MSARPIDLDMLAYDIADLFDRNRGDYGLDGLDVDSDDVRAALPNFLAHLSRIAVANAVAVHLAGSPNDTP